MACNSQLPHRLKNPSSLDLMSLSSHERYQLTLWLKDNNWAELNRFAQKLEQKSPLSHKYPDRQSYSPKPSPAITTAMGQA